MLELVEALEVVKAEVYLFAQPDPAMAVQEKKYIVVAKAIRSSYIRKPHA